MPGKYSHSVVLADYSSRGIIVLPPEQHSKYVESLPVQPTPPVSQLRLRGTRSAHAVYLHQGVQKSDRPSPVDQRHPTSGNPPVPPKDRADATVDRQNKNGDYQPMRYSRYYEQMPKSSPVINLAVQASEPELRTAYQRQQYANAKFELVPPYSRPVVQGKGQRTIPEEGLRRSIVRDSNSHMSLRKDADAAVPTTVSQPHAAKEAPSVSQYSSDARAASKSQISQTLSPSDRSRSHVPAVRQSVDLNPTALSQDRSNAKSPSIEDRSQPSKANQASSGYFSNRSASSESRNTLQTKPHESKHPQVQSPRTPILLEPDFDGFLDATPSDDVDEQNEAPVHSRDSSMNSMLPIQRPDSSTRSSSRGQHSTSTATTLQNVASAQNIDRNSPSRTTESSVKTSTRAHRSNSSISSVSISNTHSYLSPSKHSFEVPKKINESSPAGQSWRLPEISEDHGFSPSIFEDKEGETDKMRSDEFDSGTIMGQISSGKDVTFDNSDAMSELSAALPPPITRFRDEEDEFNANMTRLFGDGGDYAITKKGSHTIGRSATKKTKGFFSKFRSKS